MIKTIPHTLKNFIDSTMVSCPKCKSLLKKEIEILSTLVEECYECRYDDRPFAYGRQNKGECTCEYSSKESGFIIITCETCVLDEKEQLIKEKIKKEKNEFTEKWNKATIEERLAMYGSKKLTYLAKKKAIVNYSKMNKNELIHVLKECTTISDFPIC